MLAYEAKHHSVSSPEAVLTEFILCDKLLLFFGFLDPPPLLQKLR
jgi:hypothetical protein